jgi:uncharacterized membrane protein (UPF0127 family)
MQGSRDIEIVNLTKNTIVGSQVLVAGNAVTRLVGLLGRKSLEPGCGLLIEPSSGIHTFGMRFPIDVVALDAHMQVLGVWEKLGPCRFAAIHWRTRRVLELPAGTVRATRTELNDQLGFNVAGLTACGHPPAA